MNVNINTNMNTDTAIVHVMYISVHLHLCRAKKCDMLKVVYEENIKLSSQHKQPKTLIYQKKLSAGLYL
jgi:hypothetical protein